MHELARGAEAVISQDGDVVEKRRLPKSYRIVQLDDELRKQRTKREHNILVKCPVPAPKPISSKDDTITMSLIAGQKIREILDEQPRLAKRIGEHVAALHNAGIIHGDLTTSNMILNESGEVVMIDFGLSFHSQKTEDKAVDIHLFKEALESKHHKVEKIALAEFLEGYKQAVGYKATLVQLKAVEKRGRYRKG